jgi:hypothetical protein
VSDDTNRLRALLEPRASDGRDAIPFINDLQDANIAALRRHPDLRHISRLEFEILLAAPSREAKTKLRNKLDGLLDLFDTLNILHRTGEL